MARGYAKGTVNGRAKLSEAQVKEIFVSRGSDGEAARRFGVCRKSIRNIRSGRNWRHVTDGLHVVFERNDAQGSAA
ncbi:MULTISPECIES: hypothetical protein [unclassified Acidocella]|uniref:hypothetical protein n=1 Tax=unclassified Acidocella TaxID=2648610 RepID=UPI00028ED2A5|nr:MULTISPECIES: hypothetical protein [unclassified Acidocella]EKN01083.1 hypothetical protein MXAZACID_02219 [Acidocella sp. MX-AZ02]WBO60591.1 hypothetical protein GT370_07410 [Acidocella sp. MX-AZ03]